MTSSSSPKESVGSPTVSVANSSRPARPVSAAASVYTATFTLRIVDGPDAVHLRSVAREELDRERPYRG